MITKEEASQYIRAIARDKILTKAEVDFAWDTASIVKSEAVLTKQLGIAEILYYIGAGIVVLGISILLAQNWAALSYTTQVLATLGSGIAAYLAGLAFDRNQKTESVATAFHLIAALVMPIGLYVVFTNAGLDIASYSTQTTASSILFVAYLLSFLVFRKSIFVLFTILFGTWLFFSLTSTMVESRSIFDSLDFLEYRIIVASLAYLLIGYSFSQGKYAPLSNFLYSFGIFGFLGAALALGGWSPSQNIFWELAYPAFVFGALFLSVHLKSKAFLMWGTLYLMAYILKITSEYFASDLGWPVALVIAGLGMIGIGYMSLSLKHKYLAD
jgi:hypothetical protein